MLKVQLAKYKSVVARSNPNNGIVVHVAEKEHSTDWGMQEW